MKEKKYNEEEVGRIMVQFFLIGIAIGIILGGC